MKIFVSAGEVSGDVHASYLVNSLRQLDSGLTFFGIGSEQLAAAGVDIKFDITKRGTIGFLEALPNFLPILSIFNKAKKLLLLEKPALAILIDSQGINVPLAQFCKSIGIKTVFYIAPQEWLWGTERGLKRVAKTVDLIIAIFKKEFDLFKQAGAEVVYFGHPLLDIVKPTRAQALIKDSLGLPHKSLIVSIFPGSRSQEIRHLFPLLLNAAQRIFHQQPNVRFIIPAATDSIFELLKKSLASTSLPSEVFFLVNKQAFDCLSISDLAICTSGTINLEASILGVPNIMTYKLSPITYFIGKHILKIDKKIRFFSMPNILLDKKIIPELIMREATAQNLASTALNILNNRTLSVVSNAAFEKLRSLLGPKGALTKSAEIILSLLPKY